MIVLPLVIAEPIRFGKFDDVEESINLIMTISVNVNFCAREKVDLLFWAKNYFHFFDWKSSTFYFRRIAFRVV